MRMNTRTRSSVILGAFILCNLLTSCNSDPTGSTITSVIKEGILDSETGTATIFEAEGEGQIENFYFAGDNKSWHDPANSVLNVWCDGRLCLSGKLYELAGMGMDFCDKSDYYDITFESAFYSKLGHRNSINLDFKIPYYKSCKAELVCAGSLSNKCWVTVRARTKADITYGGMKVPHGAYFHGVRQENKTIGPGDEYTVMESSGKTMVTGINLFVNAENSFTLEGCLRAYDMKNNTVSYLSSGLEDFFLGTYYFDAGLFQSRTAGLTCLKTENGCQMSAYRLFPESPLCFRNNEKITVRNGDAKFEAFNSPGPELLYPAEKATFGGFCFYYEW